jgi:hypothetical protein
VPFGIYGLLLEELMADDLDPDLQRFLRERAAADERAASSVAADEVLVRALPHAVERRRPVFLASAAAVVLIAAVLGFAAGRTTSPAPAATVAAGDQPTEPAPAPQMQAGFAAKGFAVGDGGTAAGVRALTELFTRTTADGVTIRAYVQDLGPPPDAAVVSCPAEAWCPPPECNPTSMLVPELSTDAAVAQHYAPAFPVSDGPAWAVQIDFGQQEGAATSARAVRVADGVTHVTATWPDGTVDEMDPIGGWAVLAGAVDAVPAIVVTLADGTTSAVEATDPYAVMPQCQPPPPPLGAPGDPAAVGGGYVVNNGPATAVAPTTAVAPN